MEKIKQILELWENGVNGPLDATLFIITLFLAIYPLFIKLHSIKSFSDFDRLLLPKNERSIQQRIAIIIDYIIFSFLYFLPGLVFSILVFQMVNGRMGQIIISLFILAFALTLIPILLKVFIVEVIGEKVSKNMNLFNKIYRYRLFEQLFNLNVNISFVVYAFLLNMFIVNTPNNGGSGGLLLLFFPMILLYLYRSYNKGNNYEYLCTIISEKEFNGSMLIVNYSLDKDRIIFRKPDDAESREIFMYDRTSGKYFKFSRVNII
jgi:hypothetical protein